MPAASAASWAGGRSMTAWTRSSTLRWPGKEAGPKAGLPSARDADRRHPGGDLRVFLDRCRQVVVAGGIADLEQRGAAAIERFDQVRRKFQGGIIFLDRLLIPSQ